MQSCLSVCKSVAFFVWSSWFEIHFCTHFNPEEPTDWADRRWSVFWMQQACEEPGEIHAKHALRKQRFFLFFIFSCWLWLRLIKYCRNILLLCLCTTPSDWMRRALRPHMAHFLQWEAARTDKAIKRLHNASLLRKCHPLRRLENNDNRIWILTQTAACLYASEYMYKNKSRTRHVISPHPGLNVWCTSVEKWRQAHATLQ